MYTVPTRPLLFSAYCSSMKSSSAAVHPRQKKKVQTSTCKKKKGAIKITHPHTQGAVCRQWRKQHARVIQSGFFSSGRGYSEDEIRNYIIQKGFTGLRRG